MRKEVRILAALLASVVLVGVAYGAATSSDADNGKFKTKTYKWSAEAISMAIVDTNAATSKGVKIGQFPAGVIAVHGAVLKSHKITVTAADGITANTQGDVSVGSVTASGSDITSTEANIIPKTTQNTMTNATAAFLAAPLPIDGTSTAVGVYLNLLIDADASNAIQTNAMTSAGELQIIYSELLDY